MRNEKLRLGILCATILLFLASGCASRRGVRPTRGEQKIEREMRAAWWPTVWRGDYKGKNAAQLRNLFEQRVDYLQKIGVNTVVFQVRSESDAFYASRFEPWSRFLTGQQGVAPEGGFDPLAFLIEECHKRGMELHAWINPFRASVKTTNPTAHNHVTQRYPEWIITYGGNAYLDPAIPAVRDYVCRIVQDLVLRYDMDALHIDDYFYPYPLAGQFFADDKSFEKYGLSEGYSWEKKGDWRRENINRFIEQLHQTLHNTKPWVALGISPFGIYRNAKMWKKGSATSGLEGYEALYADVLLWAQRGWIDYLTPQIYWNYGHPSADYQVLVEWWGAQDLGKTMLYIGQDIRRTMDSNQLERKIALQRKWAEGDCFWPADDLWNNYGNSASRLSSLYKEQKVPTPVKEKGRKTSSKRVTGLRYSSPTASHLLLEWHDAFRQGDPLSPRFYLVYALPNGKKSDFPKRAQLLSISSNPFWTTPIETVPKGFAVTALNHFGVESKPVFLF